MPPQNNNIPENGELWVHHGDLLDNLLDASPDRIYFKDRDSHFIRVNHASAVWFGIGSPGEAIGKTDADIFSEEHARQAREDELHVMATGEPLLAIVEKETWPDGHITWASTTKSPMRDEAGNIIGIVGISRDITRDKHAEEALRSSEALFRTICDASPLGVVVTDEKTNTIYANAAHLRLCGRTLEEINGTKWSSVIHPDDRGRVLGKWQEISRTQQPFHSEHRYVRKGGTAVWASISAAPILHVEGDESVVRGYVAVVEDITERMKVESQLHNLSQAVEQSPAVVMITDTAGNIEYVNPKFTEVTGYTSAEVMGKNPRILKSGRTPPETYRTLWSTITAGDTWQGEILNSKKTGELFWEMASISPITDKSGTITHFIALTEDITERKQMQEQILRSQLM